ncbi:MAG: dephospho-CoA kinase [Polyangiales bacterium]
MTKPVIGLTGGIACGKSTVAEMFKRRGALLVDADELARLIVMPGTEGLAAIVAEFGETVLDENGSLDRKALGDRVFADEAARKKLNAITHPRIAVAGMHKIGALQNEIGPYILYEAALLVESGSYRSFFGLIVVSANEATQLSRLMARDQSSEADAKARIASQFPMSEKIAVADYVINNEGDLEQTEAQVETVHRALLSRIASQ